MPFNAIFHGAEGSNGPLQFGVDVSSDFPALETDQSFVTEPLQCPENHEIVEFAFIKRFDSRDPGPPLRTLAAAGKVGLPQIRR